MSHLVTNEGTKISCVLFMKQNEEREERWFCYETLDEGLQALMDSFLVYWREAHKNDSPLETPFKTSDLLNFVDRMPQIYILEHTGEIYTTRNKNWIKTRMYYKFRELATAK